MKISVLFFLTSALLSQALAENLLLTSNRWLQKGSMKARIYCSLRGESMSAGSIRCGTEVMENLDKRFSYVTNRKPLELNGKFEFSSNKKTSIGLEFFFLSGQVIKKELAYEISFTEFVHSLKLYEIIPVFTFRFEHFSTSTSKFSTISFAESHESAPNKCLEQRKFQTDRVPAYCDFHGFSKSKVEFPIFCEKEGFADYLVRTKSTCLD